MNQPIYTPGPYDTPGMIRTFTGRYVDVFDPRPEMICIEDIAHALARLCRFGGHVKRFYSVAQHSVMCSRMVNQEYQLAALLHDASEAYLVDIPKPIKEKIIGYKDMEDRMMGLIAQTFRFNYPLDKVVKLVDEDMLESEWKHLVIKDSSMLPSWNPDRAEREFLDTYKLLTTASVSA